MGYTTRHICISVRGVLAKPNRDIQRELKGAITVDGTRLMTWQEIRRFFEDELAQGHEVIPCGDCDNFDYKTGCRGHRTEEE